MKRLIGMMLSVIALCAIQAASRAGDGQGSEVTLDGLKSRTPPSWKMQKPSKFREYQFLLPRTEGDPQDAELVIFFFGPGGGGGIEENIKRWKGQVQPPAGKTIDEVSKVEKFKVGKVEVTSLDIRGTYLSRPPFDPNAKPKALPDFRFVGVIFASENGPYFLRLTGPEKTVAKHKSEFDNWLKAFK